MASAAGFIISMFTVAGGMMVLLFALSSLHATVNSLQGSLDEQGVLLRGLRESQREWTVRQSAWQGSVEGLAAAQAEQKGLIERHQEQVEAERLRKDKQFAEALQSLTVLQRDAGELQQTLQRTRAAQEEGLRLERNAREQAQHASDGRLIEVKRQLDEVAQSLSKFTEKQDAALRRVDQTQLTFQNSLTKLGTNVDKLGISTEEIRRSADRLSVQVQQAAAATSAAATSAAPALDSKVAGPTSAAATVRPKLLGVGLGASKATATEATLGSPQSFPPSSEPSTAATSTSAPKASATSAALSGVKAASTAHQLEVANEAATGHGLLLQAGRATSSSSSSASSSTTMTQAPPAVPRHAMAVAEPSSTKARETTKAPVETYQVSWFRECGCTGQEIEAVTLLTGIVSRIGASRVRTNLCSKTCDWPAHVRGALDMIEVADEASLWPTTGPGPGGLHVVVVHAAYLGVCGLPPALAHRWGSRTQDRQRGIYRVSRSMSEYDAVDDDAAVQCNNQFDAVWVPSKFNKNTFSISGVKLDRLSVLPEAVDATMFHCTGAAPHASSFPASWPSRLSSFLDTGGEETTFTFLSVFKWEDRKNWKGLLESFWTAFPTRNTAVTLEGGRHINCTVRLVIKTQQLEWGTDVDDDVSELSWSLRSSADTSPERILVVKEQLPFEALPKLYRAVDAFVLPTRGEGWGLPIMEAMASGLPTIATDWGGQTEYMHADNALPIRYVLKEAGNGHRWADPESAALVEAMQGAVRRTASTQAHAQRACREVAERFSRRAVAARFEELALGLHPGTTT